MKKNIYFFIAFLFIAAWSYPVHAQEKSNEQKVSDGTEQPKSIMITKDVKENIFFGAAENITASSKVDGNKTVVYEAGTVTLLPGFDADASQGGRFTAIANPYIQPEKKIAEITTDISEEIVVEPTVSLSPNPTRDFCIAKLNGSYSGKYVVYDLTGYRIDQGTFTDQQEITIDASLYPAGTFIVTFNIQDRIINEKIIRL
ncbi:MAG: T9SS type A sorting domain-containing protein [Bacteroidales bacterium]|nr:T9SS type A sorting domain-containing protein [Bacteroidales bacterium]